MLRTRLAQILPIDFVAFDALIAVFVFFNDILIIFPYCFGRGFERNVREISSFGIKDIIIKTPIINGLLVSLYKNTSDIIALEIIEGIMVFGPIHLNIRWNTTIPKSELDPLFFFLCRNLKRLIISNYPPDNTPIRVENEKFIFFGISPTRLSSVLMAQKQSGGYTLRVLGRVRCSYVKTRNSSFISASYFASTKVALPSPMMVMDLATILFWESTFGREKNEADDRARISTSGICHRARRPAIAWPLDHLRGFCLRAPSLGSLDVASLPALAPSCRSSLCTFRHY